MPNTKVSPANIVILVAGVLIVVASFLSFYEYDGGGGTVKVGDITVDLGDIEGIDDSSSAWSEGLFAIATLPALLGAVMALHVAVSTFARGVRLPDRLLGLTWNQVHLALGFQAAIMMVAFLLVERFGGDLGIGYWLMLLAAGGLLAGAIMRMREPAGETSPPAI
jgi:hypothetical protein